ncbi:DNA repair protein RecN [soil metagenome]
MRHLSIRDFAIIDAVDIELGDGFTVLTGETGAGKSILVEALGLALGDRAESTVVRAGAQRAEIAASFDISRLEAVAAWLSEHDLDADDECDLRRVIGSEGRSRAWVNGHLLPLRSLRALGALLVDIHGQHEHQSLLRAGMQRRLVDFRAGNSEPRERTAAAFARWRTLQAELGRRDVDTRERQARIDLLRYEVGELEALRLGPGEAESLVAEHHRLAHIGELAAAAQTALQLVYEHEEHAAQLTLGRALATLQRLPVEDPRLAESCRLIGEAEIGASEAGHSLRRYLETLDADPGRQDEVERRLADLQALARKHRTNIESLCEHLEALRDELDGLTRDVRRREDLTSECAAAEADYRSIAAELSRSRATACLELSSAVTAAMRELGMPDGVFEAGMEPVSTPAAHGLDRIEFRVSINRGQPLQPLARVASGGELSRISLGLQVIAAEATSGTCMVFDEVDAGIGGGTAEIVGRRLRELGSHRQVLCVTHLPQVASQGHHHFRTSKHSDGRGTHTTLTPLEDAARVEELSRMLGGLAITARTRDHAREMIEQAQSAASAGHETPRK